STNVVQSRDMFSGTWILNAAKSKSTPGPAAKSATMLIAMTANGLSVTLDRVDGDGKTIHVAYIASFDGSNGSVKTTIDGKPDPAGPDGVTAKKLSVSSFYVEMARKKKVVLQSRSVLTNNGRVLTVGESGTNAKGQSIDSVFVYDKK